MVIRYARPNLKKAQSDREAILSWEQQTVVKKKRGKKYEKWNEQAGAAGPVGIQSHIGWAWHLNLHLYVKKVTADLCTSLKFMVVYWTLLPDLIPHVINVVFAGLRCRLVPNWALWNTGHCSESETISFYVVQCAFHETRWAINTWMELYIALKCPWLTKEKCFSLSNNMVLISEVTRKSQEFPPSTWRAERCRLTLKDAHCLDRSAVSLITQ